MSKLRTCTDPSNVHLKREITQIQKAACVLRDPGMTAASSRSPLGTSRSIVSSQKKSDGLLDTEFTPHIGGANDGKQSRVWKLRRSSILPFQNYDSSSNNNSEEAEDHAFSVPGSSNDSLSDAHNGVYFKNDAYSGDTLSVSSVLREDAKLVLTGTPCIKRSSKKVNGHVHLLPKRSAKKNTVLCRNSRHPVALSRNDSARLSDDSEQYCRSDDLRQSSGASPLLLKQKNRNRLDSSESLREAAKEDSSNTYSTLSLSTSSCCWYKNRGSSIIGSWDGTATSLNDGDDHEDDPLDFSGSRGCGIPCYWSRRTPRHRGIYESRHSSPSLSDTFRRKGSNVLNGSQSAYARRHHRSSSWSKKRRKTAKIARDALPLPASCGYGKRESSVGTGYSDDEVYTNFRELELESVSRLDERRWSNYRSQDGSDSAALTLEQEEDSIAESIRSLSQKYKPMFFDEITGQKIVVRSLVNAVQRRRFAPVYLFQGPRGTGKTSLARIFAAALNCLTIEDVKPCGICKSCRNFISGKSKDMWEVDGTGRNGIYDIRHLLKNLSFRPPVSSASSSYKVFIIDECHLLASKTWLDFLNFIEEPPRGVVFIFITTDLNNVPRAIQSRCQKYIFSKIKDCDISARLRKISALENLDVESDAFDLIALNAGGSLRDAETILDQLSLLGKRITAALVNELVGVVSDEKLLDLLELAMSSDTAETVKRARELLDSGVDPMVLISQLAGLIMDIIAGTYKTTGSRHSESSSSVHTSHEGELEKLKHALKLLSEAKKQLGVSSEQSTWFTATILQLGSAPSPEISQPGSSQRQSSKTTEEDPSSKSWEYTSNKQTLMPKYAANHEFPVPESVLDEIIQVSHRQNDVQSQANKFNLRSDVSCCNSVAGIVGSAPAYLTSLEKLNVIWDQCIERCHSKTLRFLLHSHGKLLSISEAEDVLLTYVAFVDKDIKLRVERFLSSITNSMEIILRRNVEVILILLPSGEELLDFNNLNETSGLPHKGGSITITPIDDYSEDASQQKSLKVISRSFNDCSGASGIPQSAQRSLQLIVKETDDESEGKRAIPAQRIDSIIREQMLETAWLQATDKGSPGTLSRLRLERSLVPRDDTIRVGDRVEKALDSRHWEDKLNCELKALKVTDGQAIQNDTIRSRYPMSPSLIHCSSFAGNPNRDSLAYESRSGNKGCGSIFCWNNARSCRRRQVKGPAIRSHGSRSLSMFGRCMGSRSRGRLSQIKE